jgi:hypothetical protein
MTPLFGMSWTFDEVYERRIGAWGACDGRVDARQPAYQRCGAAIRLGAFVGGGALRRWSRASSFISLARSSTFEDEHIVPKPPAKHVQGLSVYVGIDPGVARRCGVGGL